MKFNLGDKIQVIKKHSFFEVNDLLEIIVKVESNEKHFTSGYFCQNILGKKAWVFDDSVAELYKSDIDKIKDVQNSLNEKIQERQNMKTKEEKVHEVAVALCVANNTCSTLEIKNELRRKYPTEKWYQSDVSDIMDELNNDGKFTYNSNGNFRVYSLPSLNNKNKVSSTPVKKVTKVSTPKVIKKGGSISRTKALDLIKNSNGKFFTVVFDKKDGTERKMTGQHTLDMGVSPLGYINVKDMVAVRKREKSTVKSVNLQTIKQLKINNTLYKVNS